MKKSNVIAGAAFVLGVASVQLYGHQLRKEVQGGSPTGVLVVTQDLDAGDALSEENLSVVEIPSGYLDERRVLEKERENLLGVTLQTKLQAGDSLVWSDLADGTAHRHLASIVLPGRRAYSVSAKANPLGRLLRVGDQVDVLLERSKGAETLLERVLVLAVGGKVETATDTKDISPSRNQGVALSVSARQAERLLSAEKNGSLRLILRNPDDLHLMGKKDPTSGERKQRVAKSESRQEIEHVR